MTDELIGYRVASWDTPLRANAHRTEARYNQIGSPATQYLALYPLTPWAEYCRAHGLHNPRDVASRRLTTWAVRLASESVVEIDFDNAPDWGLSPDDLVADDHAPCQVLAERLRNEGDAPKVIRVPSASLPGTRNVVIFGERVMIPYDWKPLLSHRTATRDSAVHRENGTILGPRILSARVARRREPPVLQGFSK